MKKTIQIILGMSLVAGVCLLLSNTLSAENKAEQNSPRTEVKTTGEPEKSVKKKLQTEVCATGEAVILKTMQYAGNYVYDKVW